MTQKSKDLSKQQHVSSLGQYEKSPHSLGDGGGGGGGGGDGGGGGGGGGTAGDGKGDGEVDDSLVGYEAIALTAHCPYLSELFLSR